MPQQKPSSVARRSNVVIILKGSDSPEAKSRDSNILRILFLLVNDHSNLLVSKAKLMDTNNIHYYHFYFCKCTQSFSNNTHGDSPEAKLRDSNIPRILFLLGSNHSNLLVPKAKLQDTNSISYYYFYSTNVPNIDLCKNNTQGEGIISIR